jgi:hypothetical protein
MSPSPPWAAVEQLQDALDVFKGLSRAGIGSDILKVLADHQSGEEDQLDKALGHPLHHDDETRLTNYANSRGNDVRLHQRRRQCQQGQYAEQPEAGHRAHVVGNKQCDAFVEARVRAVGREVVGHFAMHGVAELGEPEGGPVTGLSLR